VEQGVRFVEVSLGGWDTHQDADGKVRTLSNQLDPGFGTLVKDLKDRGMLDRTMVIWMGEFGRGPGNGSPHYARCWTSVLAGGGPKTGQVIGNSGSRGANAEERPISAPDFFATVCRAMGIDPNRSWMTRGNRPLERVGRGARPITELLA